MFIITNKQILSADIKRLTVLAPNIAKKVKPGQFVRVSPEEGDESIPLTVIEQDKQKGTITLVFQEVGETTGKLGSLPINESIYSIVGPLGNPALIEKKGTVVCIATGIGVAKILPICRAYHDVGNKVIGIIGAKTKKALMLEAQMRVICSKLFIATNDGTYERRGLASDIFKEVVAKQEVNLVYAVGSLEMMKAVSEITKVKNISTRVHLNSIMVDCVGMCGACRVKIAGKEVCSCTEGPEFDGHKVDFDDFKIRLKAYEESECRSIKKQFTQKKEESGILMKFLSGILRK